MTDKELQERIESSPALRRVRETLSSEVSFRAGASARFDPFTILMLISIIVQVIAMCRKRRHPDKISQDIRNARTLPRIRTWRLQKKLRELWEKQSSGSAADGGPDVLYEALVDFAERADDTEIAAVMELAEQQ